MCFFFAPFVQFSQTLIHPPPPPFASPSNTGVALFSHWRHTVLTPALAHGDMKRIVGSPLTLYKAFFWTNPLLRFPRSLNFATRFARYSRSPPYLLIAFASLLSSKLSDRIQLSWISRVSELQGSLQSGKPNISLRNSRISRKILLLLAMLVGYSFFLLFWSYFIW